MFRGTNPGWHEKFYLQNHPDLFWGPFNIVFGGYQVSFPGISRPGREPGTSSPSGAEFKNEWSYTSTSLVCVRVVDKEDFTVTSPVVFLEIRTL
jgi:hypothetical protein